LKSFSRSLFLCILLVFGLASCGYHNPYVYNGPDVSVYITTWKNRTSELRLDSKLYQSLIKWYQKSGGSIRVKKEKEGADFILAGEIVSIDLPSLSYGSSGSAVEVKVRLTVRYILKSIKTGKVLIEMPNQVYSEAYNVTASSAANKDNESKALDQIINDLSEQIYLRTLNELKEP
jgi:outer membrane lipopolysaccharide assembly protein LptE/RlpB